MTGKLVSKLAPLRYESAPLRNRIITSLRSAIETGLLQPGERLMVICKTLDTTDGIVAPHTARAEVRYSGKTGSVRPTAKTTRMTPRGIRDFRQSRWW